MAPLYDKIEVSDALILGVVTYQRKGGPRSFLDAISTCT